MATAFLIVGCLLAVPPFFVLPQIWRRRWWLAYLVEVTGALCLAVGWALSGRLTAFSACVGWAVGFGVTFPLFAGRGKRWWVVVATGLVTPLVLGILGYGLVRTRFRKTEVAQETTGKALSDFRRSAGAALKEEQGTRPYPGVYEFNATGHYEVTVKGLGKDRRVLPGIVPAVLVSQGDCWELTVRYFKQHHWTVRYCSDPKVGLRMMWLRNVNEFFGLRADSQFACEPNVMVGPGYKPGRQWPQRCRAKNPNPIFGKSTGGAVVRYMGVETVVVGGVKVRAHHVRRTVHIKGLQAAVLKQRLWYTDSGMMVRFHVNAVGSGMAKFVSVYGLTLRNLSPKR